MEAVEKEGRGHIPKTWRRNHRRDLIDQLGMENQGEGRVESDWGLLSGGMGTHTQRGLQKKVMVWRRC